MTKNDRIWSMLFILSSDRNSRDSFLKEADNTGKLATEYSNTYSKFVEDPDCLLDTYHRKNAWILGLKGSKPVNYGEDPEYDIIHDAAIAFRDSVKKFLNDMGELEITRLYKKTAVL